MRLPNKSLINALRGLLVVILGLIAYNGLSSNPNFSQTSSWREAWYGLAATLIATWGVIEILNRYLVKTKIGHLPSYFWFIAAGLNGADFFNSASKLFELPYFDKIVHAANNFFITLLIFILIQKITKVRQIQLSPFLFYYLTITTVNFLGVAYEVLELIGDKYLGAANITSAFDTTTDLLFNNIGVAAFLILEYLTRRVRGPTIKSSNLVTIYQGDDRIPNL